MKFPKIVLTSAILLSLFGCSMKDLPFIGEEKKDIIQEKSKVIKNTEKKTETQKEKPKKDIPEKISKTTKAIEIKKDSQENFHKSAPTNTLNQTPALLNRYKDMIEDNTVLIAIKNNKHSVTLLENQEIAILELIKEVTTEFGQKKDDIDMIYEMAIKPFFENLKQIERINIYLHLDPNTIADLIQKQKLVKDLGVEKFIEQTSKDIPEGICLALEVETQAKKLKEYFEYANALIRNPEEMPFDADINTKDGIYKVQIGCKNESIPSFNQLPENSNIIVIQKGQISKSFEQLQKLTETAEKNVIFTRLDDIINQLNTQLNSHLIMSDQKSVIGIFSVLESGYKTQVLESYTNPKYQSIRNNFFTGEALREEFFMNTNAIHKSNIQMPKGKDEFEVYAENSYENLDWTHWIGRLEKSGLNAAIVIPMLGIGSTVAITTMNTYKEKAKSAERLTIIRNTGTLLKTARAVESIKKFPNSAVEVYKILKNEGGYSIPKTTDNHCVFYASHPKITNEFLVFTDGKDNRISMDGTSKAKKAISKFLRKNKIKTLNCTAPKLPGFKVLNLSQ